MGHDRVFVGVHVLGVDLFKFLVGALLAVKELQHYHPGDMLLQVRIDAGNSHANAPVGVTDSLAEDHGGPEDQWQNSKGDKRQPPFHAQHDDHDAQQHEYVFKNGHHAGGKHLV